MVTTETGQSNRPRPPIPSAALRWMLRDFYLPHALKNEVAVELFRRGEYDPPPEPEKKTA